MTPDPEFLQRCAAETGFRHAALEKVIRLGEVVDAIGRHPLLGRSLALKGGTALNLAFGPPTRLSVDLDFNFVASADREAMLSAKPAIESTALELGRRLGYRVQQSRDEFAGRKLYLNYRSALGPEDRIEVDLNYLMRLPIGDAASRVLWRPGGLDRPRAAVVSPMELAIGKFLALLDRSLARDLWDVAHLPGELAMVAASTRFRPWFIGMLATLPNQLSSYTRARIEDKVTVTAIEEQLVPMLVGGQAAVAGELMNRAWTVIEPYLNLAEHERAYLDAFSVGELRPDLLFGDDAESASRLGSHPAIRWRLQNIRGYLKKATSTHPAQR